MSRIKLSIGLLQNCSLRGRDNVVKVIAFIRLAYLAWYYISKPEFVVHVAV